MIDDYDVVVCDCTFEDLSKQGNGGAIDFSIISKKICIGRCHFYRTCVSESGGACYLQINVGSIFDCSFDSTYTSKHKDNEGVGNAFCCDLCVSTSIKRCIFNHCGPDSQKCSDSTYLINGIVKAEFLNSTSNYGVGGSSALNVIGNCASSYAKYINDIDSHEAIVISAFDLIVLYSNIIDSTNVGYGLIYSLENDQITFQNCTFINIPNKISWTDTTCKFISCSCNKQIDGITYTISPETYNIFFTNIPKKIIDTHTHICRNYNYIISPHLFLISISISINK